MGIGLSGMISGLDTDSIVKAMVSAQQTKATKIENKITLNKWTTEAWSSLNTKIYSFYTKYASKLRLQSSYMTRTAKSSNESAVTATAGSTAAVGTHSLQIKQLASSQYVTSAQLKTDTGSKADYNKNSKLTEMGTGVEAGTIITITGKKGTDDETVTKLEVTESTTVNDFLNACKEAGLTATFDTTQQRFFISSSQSGKDDAFSITTSALSTEATNAFAAVEGQVDTSLLSATEKTTYDAALATLRQNLDVIGTVLSDDYNESDKTQKAVYDAINVVKDAAAKNCEKKIADESEAAAITEEDDKITSALADAATSGTAVAYGSNTLTFDELFATAEAKVTADNEAAAVQAGNAAVAGMTDVTAEKYTAAQTTIANATDVDGNAISVAEDDIDALVEAGTISEDTANALKDAYASVNAWEASYDITDEDGNVVGTTTAKDAYTAAYNASVAETAATLDADIAAEMAARLKADQQETYDANVEAKAAELAEARAAEIETEKTAVETNLLAAATAGVDTPDADDTSALAALGLGEIDGSTVSDGGTNGMAVVAAANAEFVLDGATMEETSNNFTVNGITLNLASTTYNKDTGVYDSVQITVGKDSDSTYELIKEALKEYNTLIEEMNTLYNADSARDYDPLTDEQKEAMSETEIEDWENKIKSSLLRRDNTLGTLLSSMRTALSSTYTDEDGKTYSLSTYGIVTGTYTENGKLHIYGDEDDATYATYTDRLKTALEDDPDKVMEVLTNVFGNLYTTMTEKCAKTEISSALTFYNDKQYSSLLEDYEDDLDIMEDRIADLEDKYYKQFTAMETALSKLQSQQNSLASLLGTSTQ